MEKKRPTHRMTRRSATHDYTLYGTYHITLHVAEGLGHPLGRVEGSIEQPDGTPDGPHVVLTPLGQMIRHELLNSISAHYPMLEVQDYVIMPEHLHFLLVVHKEIISQNGKAMALGQVLAGFKLGCNRRYWELTQQAQPVATREAGAPAPEGASASAGVYPPLFAPGFCDVIPITDEQLATQRRYIKEVPRSRLLRTTNRAWLTPQRGGIDTAVTLTALRGFLRRECPQQLSRPEALALVERRLLLAGATITCDTYGDRALLQRQLLPVVCHRKDTARFNEQRQRCLEAAAQGAVLVSARIAKGEQAILNEAMCCGYAVVLIADNGFADRFQPSAERIDQCADSRLLLVTPWQYEYRSKNESLSVPFCKTMNCVAQALSRTRDDWWKNSVHAGQASSGSAAGTLPRN